MGQLYCLFCGVFPLDLFHESKAHCMLGKQVSIKNNAAPIILELSPWTESSLFSSESARRLKILCGEPAGLQALLEDPQNMEVAQHSLSDLASAFSELVNQTWKAESPNVPEEPAVPCSSSVLNATVTATSVNWTA